MKILIIQKVVYMLNHWPRELDYFDTDRTTKNDSTSANTGVP
jgi:hypothetical protein